MSFHNLVLSGAFIFGCGSAGAEALTLTLKSSLTGDFDWCAQASYQDAARAPAAGDTVVIPANMTATLKSTDTASWNLVSSLLRVTPNDGATFAVDVADGTTNTLACQVSWYSQSVTLGRGKLYKTGGGTLLLERTMSLIPADKPQQRFDYRVNFDVRAGAVKLPDGLTEVTSVYLGCVHLEAGAVFGLANWKSGAKDGGTTCVYWLTGEGRIVQENKNRQKLQFNKLSNQTCVFDGTYEGAVWASYYGDMTLTQPFPKLTALCRVLEGATLNFNDATQVGPTSQDLGGRGTYHYNGTSPVTITNSFWYTDVLTFDAGAAGGVTLKGNVRLGTAYKIMPFYLSGDSATPSVLDAAFIYKETDVVGNLVKRGTTTWRKTDMGATEELTGAVTVENGTLEFTTLAERGTKCALGTATQLYSNVFETVSKKYAVPWAFLLGGDGTEGFLDYVGTATASCSTRPFAIRSVGGIRADSVSNTSLHVGTFSAVGAGAKTLVLGGTNTSDNTASDISDGEGTLGIEKRDTGTWKLTGTQSFSGPVNVTEGTLVVNNNPANTPYRYFRFYIKENAFSACTNNTADGFYANIMRDDCKRWTNSVNFTGTNEFRNVRFYRLHFYDADGRLAVSNLTSRTLNSPYATDANLDEGTFTFSGPNMPDSINTDYTQSPTNLFRAGDGNSATWRFAREFKLDDSSTWGCLELRVKDDAPEIAGYDVRLQSAANKSPFEELSGRAIVSWEVHGSADGVNYEPLHSVTGFKFWGGKDGKTSGYWTFDSTNLCSTTASHANGKFHAFVRTRSQAAGDTPDPLANASFVSVAPGATLDVRGTPLTLSKLKIAAAGAGTFKNVTFAAAGELALTGHTTYGQQFYPIDLSGTTDSANLSKWSITVDGSPRTRSHVRVTPTGLVYSDPGMMIIIR